MRHGCRGVASILRFTGLFQAAGPTSGQLAISFDDVSIQGEMPVAVSEYEPAMGPTWVASRRGPIPLRRPIVGIGMGVATLSLIALIVGLSATFRVKGLSMSPNLRSGDLVLVDPFTRWFGALHRGEVVTVLPPAVPGSLEVKRIIGMPGDQLEIRSPVPGSPLTVYVRRGGTGHWRQLSEPYLGSAGLLGCCTATGRATEDPRPFTVPAGEYFVMGDNRSLSYDSRDYGPVPRSAILEQVVWLITPWSQFGSVPINSRATPSARHANV